MYNQRPHENSPHNVDETTMKLFVIFGFLVSNFWQKLFSLLCGQELLAPADFLVFVSVI
jgi:hypothetical protein